MSEVPCGYCGTLVKVSPSRWQRIQASASRRRRKPRAFCTRQHYTAWRRERNLALDRKKAPELAKVVCRAVRDRYDYERVRAAAIGYTPITCAPSCGARIVAIWMREPYRS